MAMPPQNNLHSDEKPPRRPGSILPAAPPVGDAPLLQTTDAAGPRPLSERQKAKQAEGRPVDRHNVRVYEAPVVPPIRPPYAGEPAKTQTPRRSKSVRAVRDADTTRVRRPLRLAKNSANRRRVNYPRLLLGWATAALVVEVVAAALWSPRLWVKTVRVEGNTTVPTARLLARLHIGPHDNLVRLPVGKLQTAIQAEPSVEWAEVKRTLPPGVQVFVRERTPWANVQVDGMCYTIDRNLVPFRKSETPESHLPRLVLSGTGATTITPALGKPMTAPGLQDVSRCLAWSAAQPDFPLQSVEIDPQGKLCLNKVGGLPIKLGSGVDLDKKLQTFAALLATRPELREGQNAVEEINLFAFDAPAVKWRVASNAAAATPPAVAAPPVLPLDDSLPVPVSPAPQAGAEIVP